MRRPLTLLTVAAMLVASSAALNRYTVRRGDTLGGVARRLGVSVDALARANNIKNRNLIRAGQALVVPAKPGAAKPAAAPAKPSACSGVG